ncbi:MAG: MFS transporter [Kiritimatiellaeota bacterium]|nr:MFS transporter [Kiritimatiellota bacterium]
MSSSNSMFRTPDGKNLAITFMLVSSLFLLWGFLNGMIDVMDKHFQEELHLTLAQSATVQFAHYLGYFLMSLPAGWLATKLGYKGGIIAGLLMVALGGFWFIPATQIAQFWAFLVGVGLIASGLTFLETIANPYTTVLGDPRFAATRINLAQSCNGIGWIFGPIVGGLFFYGKDAAGKNTGSQTLYIPYAVVAVVVLVLAVVFYFANVPDIKTEDDYHLDDKSGDAPAGGPDRLVNRPLVYVLLLANAVALTFICGMILKTILTLSNVQPPEIGSWITNAEYAIAAILLVAMIPTARKISHHSIWSHPHFSAATLAQFFYVAAQAGIFSFLINYMTSQTPPIPVSWSTGLLKNWFDTSAQGVVSFSNQGASNLAALGFFCFLAGRFSGAGLLRNFSAHKVLGLYGLLNVIVCLLVFLKLGWFSVLCVFASYFLMSIMFPTIFALGIFGLGARAKRASSFIVMAIMGGAILPKVMGGVADKHGMSKAFIVPLICFALVGLFGFIWPKLSGAESMQGVKTTGGH